MFDPMTIMGGLSAGASIIDSLFGGDDEPAPQVVQAQRDLPDWLKSDIQGGLSQYNTATSNWKPTEFQGVGLQPEHLAARMQAMGIDPSRFQSELDYASSSNLPALTEQFYQDPSAAIGASRAQWEEMVKNPMVRGIGDQAVGAGSWGGTQMGTAIGRGVGQAATTQQAQEKQFELNAIQQAIQNAMGAQGAARTQAGVEQALPWGDVNQQSTLGSQLWQPQWTENLAEMGLNQTNQLAPIQFAQNQLGNLGGLAQAFGQTTTSSYGGPAAYQQPTLGSGALAGGLGMYNMMQKAGDQPAPYKSEPMGGASGYNW